jgi:hypothetical protein
MFPLYITTLQFHLEIRLLNRLQAFLVFKQENATRDGISLTQCMGEYAQGDFPIDNGKSRLKSSLHEEGIAGG